MRKYKTSFGNVIIIFLYLSNFQNGLNDPFNSMWLSFYGR